MARQSLDCPKPHTELQIAKLCPTRFSTRHPPLRLHIGRCATSLHNASSQRIHACLFLLSDSKTRRLANQLCQNTRQRARPTWKCPTSHRPEPHTPLPTRSPYTPHIHPPQGFRMGSSWTALEASHPVCVSESIIIIDTNDLYLPLLIPRGLRTPCRDGPTA